MGFRRRLANSRLLAWVLGRCIGLWLRLCRATTRWQVEGRAELDAALAQGPVVLVLWHECTMMAPALWPAREGPLTSLRDISPVGNVSASVQQSFGLQPMAMFARASNRSASREVLRRLGEGVSVGLTGDGPIGPHRVLKEAPLDWARASGRPVFLMGWAVVRHRRLPTWDRMILPMPFTRGVLIWHRWAADLPRRPTDEALAALRADLSRALDSVTDTARTRLQGG